MFANRFDLPAFRSIIGGEELLDDIIDTGFVEAERETQNLPCDKLSQAFFGRAARLVSGGGGREERARHTAHLEGTT